MFISSFNFIYNFRHCGSRTQRVRLTELMNELYSHKTQAAQHKNKENKQTLETAALTTSNGTHIAIYCATRELAVPSLLVNAGLTELKNENNLMKPTIDTLCLFCSLAKLVQYLPLVGAHCTLEKC